MTINHEKPFKIYILCYAYIRINKKNMTSLEQLEQEIENIKLRNQAVEKDKAWELSKTRKFIVFLLTYIVIVLFFAVVKLPKPFLNSIVPAIAFILSTSTINSLKKCWIKRVYKINKYYEHRDAKF